MASAKQFMERRNNIAAIISYIRKRTRATRADISLALSLSWACVSELVKLLINAGILIELTPTEPRASSEAKGRVPTLVALNEDKYFLGVDINDSGIAISILSMSGRIVAAKKWNEEIFETEDELAFSVCSKIDGMLLAREDCCGIGVAMEGSRAKGGGWNYPLKKGYAPISPASFIEERFGLPVFVRHDPECMLYAVAANGEDGAMAVRVDNGVGVAAMKDGRILDLPLELGCVRIGEKRIVDILREGIAAGDYNEFMRVLGLGAANLAMLLGIKKVFIVGEIVNFFREYSEVFSGAFNSVSRSVEYVVSTVLEASCGAARVAMAEYPITTIESRNF